MEIYDRIKQRRKELGLSASDLAKALGVSRATIYRYESAYIEKLPLPALGPLAHALKCSPEYLMGWSDQTLDIKDRSQVLTPEEETVLEGFRCASADSRGAMLAIARSALDSSNPQYTSAQQTPQSA